MKKLAAALLAYGLLAGVAFGQVPNAGSPMVPNGGGGGGGGSGTVTSIATTCGVSGGTITTTGTISSTATQRNTTATSDTITSADCGNVVTESNASPVGVAITTAGFSTGNYFTIKNKGAGLATYTPSSGTIDGSATLACAQNQSADLVFDGTNYIALGKTCGLSGASPGGSSGNLQTNNGSGGFGAYAGVSAVAHQWISALTASGGATQSQPACADISNAGALCPVTPGTGVATAAANNLSSAGGLTSTIFRGTAVMGTSAIASGACATVVTVAATNVVTTDVVTASFNGDPTGVTGFVPSASGVLTEYVYPTAGNINIKECNFTAGSITPGAHTFNIAAVR